MLLLIRASHDVKQPMTKKKQHKCAVVEVESKFDDAQTRTHTLTHVEALVAVKCSDSSTSRQSTPLVTAAHCLMPGLFALVSSHITITRFSFFLLFFFLLLCVFAAPPAA